MTSLAIPLVLTRARASDFGRHQQERSVIFAFREAGFGTYWISTQNPLGHWDTNVTLHARDAENVFFLNKSTAQGWSSELDGKILPLLKRIVSGTSGNLFVAVHTLGSHYKYDLRYPEAFEVFRPSTRNIRTRISDSHYKDLSINAYDNSILYTDYIVTRLSPAGLLSKATPPAATVR